MTTIDSAIVPIEHRVAKLWYRQLYVQVLVAISLGVLIGHFFPASGIALKPLGDAFIKLVKMVIAPVVFLTVSTGLARSANAGEVGRVLGKALVYFIAVSTLALAIGLVVANVVRPGAGLHIDAASLDPKAVAEFAASYPWVRVIQNPVNGGWAGGNP